MIRLIACCVVCCWAMTAVAQDFAGAEIVRVASGQVTFKHEGKNTRLPVALSLKIIDDQGKTVDAVTGTARYLLPGNIVDIKTTSKNVTPQKSRSKSKTAASAPEKQIVEIRFLSGKIAELPGTKEGNVELNLLPEPGYKGNVFGGEGVKRDPYWIAYIPTARVGDFVVYQSGPGKLTPHRIETVEVGKDYVIIAKVWYIEGSRQEQREKHRVGPESSAAKAAKPTAQTQELEVAGKKIRCDVETNRGQPFRWKSKQVPYDGMVRHEVNDKPVYVLTDFGRGSK